MQGSASMSELGDLIKEVREDRKLSQRELSRRAGVASSTISFIERGLTERPDPDTLSSIANALGLDTRLLLEKAGIIEPDPSDELKSVRLKQLLNVFARLPAKDQEELYRLALIKLEAQEAEEKANS